jgi:hypothetical protein
VYAAASGLIVLARLSSHAGTESDPRFGSQRFLLVQHVVHLATERDPSGIGERVNYAAAPTYVYSLYIHLGPIHDIAAEDDRNPPWFNVWRRANAAADIGMDASGDKGRVFAPNVEVSVGDILGSAGRFRGRRVLHFEVLTHRDTELTMAPWNNAQKRAADTDDNAMCDVAVLDRFLTDVQGDGLDAVDVLRAAPRLRDVKTMHKSEWALVREDQIASLIPHVDRRRAILPHIRRFSWVADGIGVNPSLRDRLGTDAGMFWHYHPITFMQHVNRLIVGENREVPEQQYRGTNVETSEDYYFTDFVNWDNASASFASANADAQPVRPHDVSSSAYAFRFTRRDIACHQPGAHDGGVVVMRSTRFSVALLELFERVSQHFGAAVVVTLSHVCRAHAPAGVALCALGTAADTQKHAAGVAVDFRPSAATPASCRRLWTSVTTIVDAANSLLGPEYAAGTPTQANLPSGYVAFRHEAHPASAQGKLAGGGAQVLTAAEAAGFHIHLELEEARVTVAPADVTPLPVRLRVSVESLVVLDDRDFAGAGEWSVQCSLNGALLGSFSRRSARTGEIIPLSGWTRELTLDPTRGEAVQLYLTGTEEDVFFNDQLGSVRCRYDRRSSPAWGIGQHQERSSNESYSVNFRIESLNTGY